MEIEVCMGSDHVGAADCGTLQEFFDANPVASVERTVKQTYEAISLSTQWLSSNNKAIETWLNKL